MVVIPFTYLKPGFWELRCCGDIMSDFLGLSWQQSVQLIVLPKATQIVLPEPKSPLLAPAKSEIQEDFSENLASTSEAEITVEPTPTETSAPQPTPLVAQAVVESEPDSGAEIRDEEKDKEGIPELAPLNSLLEAAPSTPPEEIHPEVIATTEETPEVESETVEVLESIQPRPEAAFEPSPATPSTLQPLPVVSTSDDDEIVENEVVLAFLANQSVPPEPAESQEDKNTLPSEPTESEPEPAEPEEDKNTLVVRSAQTTTSANPILDQSLQMLEQILQQVLEPVMQEFDRAEPSESPITFELEESLESATNQLGLILTLDEESLVARSGESLTLSGQVDVLDVNQLNGSEVSNNLNTAFQGSLRYELRDPQTSRVLVDVQHPLPQQALPIAFNHSLEIPSECPTRLLLGKVTLYESTSAALASQPFTVTADLEELLGAIIPGTQAMPVAKVMVLANNLPTFQESQEGLPEVSVTPIKQPVLDLVDVTQNRPSIPLKPSSGSPLPPQIYQPTATPKTSKSLQLPKLPKLRPITQSLEVPEVFVELASLPVVTQSEPELVEREPQESVEPLQPLALSTDMASAIPKSLPAETPDIEPEPQLQDALQQLEEAILQIQSADALSSGTMMPSVAPKAIAPAALDGSVPVVEAANGTARPEEGASSDRKVFKAGVDDTLGVINADSPKGAALEADLLPRERRSEALETPEDADFTSESPLGDSEDIDEWAISIYSDDSSLNGLDATGTEIQSAVPPVAESVGQHNREVIPPELELAAKPSDSNKEQGGAALGALEQELAQEQSEHPLEAEPAVLDNAFQSLNIQDRFWSRLNSLATDAALSQWLSPEPSPSNHPADDEDGDQVTQPSEPVGIDVAEVTQPLTSNTLLTDFDEGLWQEESDDFDPAIAFGTSQGAIADTEPLQLPPLEESTFPEDEILDQSSVAGITDTDWATQSFEFVVDDEDSSVPEKPLVTHEDRVTPEVSKKASSVTPPQPQREIRPPRQLLLPVPAPELSIPTSELAAGEPVTVRVKLPPHPARLSVKLWVQDRQSRSLLDGPRWLMDLIPDRAGEQEALTQLTVPFGSVEIRFEAIAVDIDSQRESHKVALDCVVVPPDLPNFSLDEFEM